MKAAFSALSMCACFGLMAALAPDLAAHGFTYAIAIDPGNSSRLYAGSDDGFLVSTDAGATWTESNTGLPFGKVSAIVLDPVNPSTIYAGSIAVFKSTNGGASWSPTGSGIPDIALGVTALAIDPVNSSIIYAGLFAHTGPGVMISKNGGGTWVPVTDTVLPLTTFVGLAVDPRNTSIVYGASMNGGVFKSTNGGANWTDVSQGLPSINIHALAMDPSNSSTLYVRVRDNGVYKTTNGGASWSPAKNGLANSVDLIATISALAIDPTNPSVVYTGSFDGGVFKSTDGGASWTPAGAGLPDNSGGSLLIDPKNPSIVYAGTNDGRIFKSTDGAATFSASTPPPADLSSIGSLGQIASAGTWKMILNFVNLGTTLTDMRADFYDNSGAAMVLPFTFPQQAPAAPVPASSLDRTLNAGAQLVIESTGPDSAPAKIGWAELLSLGDVSGFGIFSNATLGWNAVVPLETRGANSYILAFDNTGTLATGLAVANVGTSAANISVIIRDDSGAQIGTEIISLAARGHDSFMLNEKYAVTARKRGTIEFDTPQGGEISVLGLRANGPALTTLPVLANVGTTGGSIAHATYNGGFTSIFYLVNRGTASATFTLRFFDEAGKALSVPLLLPQTGSVTTTTALTRALAAGAMLVAETQAQDALPSVVGSAQLETDGRVSGFEIFRWTTFGQEASVPLETRTPDSFVLVFDNTNGLTTGVALANQGAAAANVTTKIYDDAGALVQTTAIALGATGHTSFLLPSNFPVTANKRGMVEFQAPVGGRISVIGLRAKGDGSLTTIPVLVR